MNKPAAASHEHHDHQHQESDHARAVTASGMSHGGHDEHASHDRHAGHSVEMFRQKFWGTFLLSIPTIIWAPMIQHWFGYEAPGGAFASRWVPAIFGTAVFAYGGMVFIKGAIGEIRDRLPGMMTLISLAIGVAFVFSLANIFAIPLAAGVLAPWGVVLPAAMGAVLMSLSTIVVAVNAQLLRRVSL